MARIELRMFATLRPFQPEGGPAVDIPDGTSVQGLIDLYKLPEKEVNLVFVNGVAAGRDKVIQDGDRVGLFPAVGGG